VGFAERLEKHTRTAKTWSDATLNTHQQRYNMSDRIDVHVTDGNVGVTFRDGREADDKARQVLEDSHLPTSQTVRKAVRHAATATGVKCATLLGPMELIEILADEERWDTSHAEVVRESLRRYGMARKEVSE